MLIYIASCYIIALLLYWRYHETFKSNDIFNWAFLVVFAPFAIPFYGVFIIVFTIEALLDATFNG